MALQHSLSSEENAVLLSFRKVCVQYDQSKHEKREFKAKEMRESGNQLFQQRKFPEALNLYYKVSLNLQ